MPTIERVSLDISPANALDRTALHRLWKQLRRIERDKTVRVVILASGCAGVFSSGLHLRRLLHTSRWRTVVNLVTAEWRVYRLVQVIRRSRKLYVAEMDGCVIGSAVSLALACDLRYGTTGVWFWLPDPKYGGLLADGGLLLAQAIGGASAAQRMGLAMHRLSADEALACGCLNQLVKRDALTDTVRYTASELASRSALSLQYTKRILHTSCRLKFPWWPLLRTACSSEMFSRLQEACRQEDMVHNQEV